MKAKVLITVLTMSMATSACAQNQGNVNGALIGGALGYVFGDGSGHQKEIAAGSAVAGYLIGGRVSNQGYNNGYYNSNDYYYRGGARGYCDNQVPYQYRGNAGAARSWSNGCVNRLQQEQQLLEREAFESGINSRQ